MLTFGTVLTMVAVPVLYATFYGVQPRPRMAAAKILAVVLASLVAGVTAGAEDARPLNIVDVAREIGFGEEQQAAVLRGEVVSAGLEESDETELAVVVALRTSDDVASVSERLRGGPLFELRRTILAHGEIPLGGDANAVRAAFEGLTLPAAELDSLARAEPGTVLNLSVQEIASLRAAADAAPPGERQEPVADAYRDALAHRVRDYLEKGLPGIASYAREGGEHTSVTEVLRAPWTRSRLFDVSLPDLKRVLLGAPVPGDADTAQSLYWFLQDVDDRPTAVLSHRLFAQREGVALLYERQFYVGQSYNALQILAGVFDTPDGTVVVYSNRTSTDRVAGFGSSAAHAVGRRLLGAKAVELLSAFRTP